jgi:SRSO17 transposase
MSPSLPVGLAEIEGWQAEFDRLHERLRPHAVRERTHARMKLHLEGVLGKAERCNAWHLAEAAGDESPFAMQHLLGRASWDVTGVREETRRYVQEGLGSEIRARIVDESGFLKKGEKSAGVARQYSGTAGRVENCQIGVFLAYATTSGCAYVDAELYLPESWTTDRARCRAAGIPKDTLFQTKPQLAQRMLERAHAADGPVQWVLADEVYGRSQELRGWLEEQRQSYVLAVACNLKVRLAGQASKEARRADEVVAGLPAEAWQCLSAGEGSKGPRLYDWAWLEVESSDLPEGGSASCWRGAASKMRKRSPTTSALLPRRSPCRRRSRRRDCAGTSRAASSRPSRRWVWTSTRSGGGKAGGASSRWGCWPTPFWRCSGRGPMAKGGSSIEVPGEPAAVLEGELVPLSVAEVRRLFRNVLLLRSPASVDHMLGWSRWRRRHQARARHFHYQRRARCKRT